jgi:site-specific DNA recombinase
VAILGCQAGLAFRKTGTPVRTATVHHILRNPIYAGDFEWNGRAYHGVHQPLISREPWRRVQDALHARNSLRPKRQRHAFAFAGLVHCGHCGCAMVGEVKKSRYVYYHCTGYKGKCPEPYTREEALEDQFADALRCLALEPDVLEWVTTALRQSHQDEKRFHDEAISRLQAEQAVLQNRLDAMYVDKLDGRVSVAFFDRRAAEWRAEQERIQEGIQQHQQANRTYLDAGIRLLELAARAHEVFRGQPPAEKRELLKFVVSNATWRSGRLSVSYRQPFDLIVQSAHQTVKGGTPGPAEAVGDGQNANWLGREDSNLRSRIQSPLPYLLATPQERPPTGIALYRSALRRLWGRGHGCS